MFSVIKKWIASKGGWSHVIALAGLFCVGAYHAVPAFHALVLTLHAALPSWAQELVGVAAGLWAFYKNWSPKSAA